MMDNMKREQISWIYKLGLLSCTMLLGACMGENSDSGLRGPDATELRVHTRAIGENTAIAALQFWDDVTFHLNLVSTNNQQPKPYGTVIMDRYINYFRNADGETFSTGLTYEEGKDDYLHVTGYAPYEALSPAVAENNLDYTHLIVKEEFKDGTTDFLCCDGNVDHRGSSSDPFTDPQHELEFRHLTSRIRFVGKRDETMYGVISVNNVKITLLQDSEAPWHIPVKFEAYTYQGSNAEDDKFTYLASELQTPESIELSPENQNYIPSGDNGMDLSACYVLHTYPTDYDPFKNLQLVSGGGKITLHLNISADFSWYNGGSPELYQTFVWENQFVAVQSPYGNTMYPGCEYVVYITFKREEITLQGVQQVWEDGGIHYLPISPENNN